MGFIGSKEREGRGALFVIKISNIKLLRENYQYLSNFIAIGSMF